MKRAMLHGVKALGRVGRASDTANAALLGEGLVEGPTDRATPRFPRRPSLPVSLVVAVIAWVSLAAWQALAIAGGYVTRDVPRGLKSGEYVLEVVEDAKLGSYGYSMHARVLDANGVARDVLATYGDADIEGDARLFARQRVVASVSFSEFSEASFSRYASKGLCARAKLTQATIVDGAGPISFVVSARCFARDVFDEFEGRGAALVRAIVIGDRSKLEEGGLYDDVKTVGLAHMVAVSGAHLSVVAALAGALLARARMPRVALSIALCLCSVYGILGTRHSRGAHGGCGGGRDLGRSPFVVACGARGMRMRFACCASSECAVVVIFPFSCIDFGNRGACAPHAGVV